MFSNLKVSLVNLGEVWGNKWDFETTSLREIGGVFELIFPGSVGDSLSHSTDFAFQIVRGSLNRSLSISESVNDIKKAIFDLMELFLRVVHHDVLVASNVHNNGAVGLCIIVELS